MSNPQPPNDPNNPFGASGQGQPGGQYPGTPGQPEGQYPGSPGQPGGQYPGGQGQPGSYQQPGAYGPPSGGQGGYGPAGDYNQGGGVNPNPYPTQDPYGQQGFVPGAPRDLSVGDALNYAWKRFAANPAPWVVLTIALFVLSAATAIVAGALSDSTGTASSTSGSFSVSYSPAGIGINLLGALVGLLFGLAFTSAALKEVDGTRPSFGDFFSIRNFGMALLTAVVVNLIVAIGLTAYIIPGLVLLFLLWFATYVAIDQKASVFEAIGSSWKLITGNAGPLLLIAAVMFGINLAGMFLCGLGLLVTLPLTYLVGAYAYRVVSGQPVAPAQA